MLSILNNYIFLLFLTTIAFSNNLVLFFISWIGLNISLYGILLKSFNSYNKEMTLKYFISGSVVTVFLLFSIMLYFMDYFTLSFLSPSYIFFSEQCLTYDYNIIYINKAQKFFYSIILGSLLFKLGAFPFHFYLSDIYQTLNEKETMFLYTIVLKVSIFFTMLKFISNFWYLNGFVSELLIMSGFGSIFVSSFSILKQYKLAKIWAYSYLNSIGFTLISIVAGTVSDIGELSFYSAKIYFFVYLITWFGILDFISTISIKTKNSVLDKKLYYVSDLVYINSTSLFLSKNSVNINNKYYEFFKLPIAYHFLILVVSLLGLPPTFGFFSKALIYANLLSNHLTILIFILVLITTPLISFAYLKLIIYAILGVNSKTNFQINNNTILIKISQSQFPVNFRIISFLIFTMPSLLWIFNCFDFFFYFKIYLETISFSKNFFYFKKLHEVLIAKKI